LCLCREAMCTSAERVMRRCASAPWLALPEGVSEPVGGLLSTLICGPWVQVAPCAQPGLEVSGEGSWHRRSGRLVHGNSLRGPSCRIGSGLRWLKIC
jgi:hypothetical protein